MSVTDFYRIELDKLKNESRKIALFTKHPTTIGSYREKLLREYLSYFTPKNLTIESGFVYDFENALKDSIYADQTKQIDCLVFDNNNYTPFLRTTDFAIIEPAALFAGIEIKSNLTFFKEYDHNTNDISEKYPLKNIDSKPYRWSGTLIDALINIKSLKNISNPYNKNFFSGIFAYSSDVNLTNFLFAFDNNELQMQLSIKHLKELPQYICVLDKFLIYFSRVPITMDESFGFDPSETEMSILEAVEENIAFPLQFFTNAYKINIEHKLNKKKPHKNGLFTAGLGNVKLWGHHFRLNSDD